MSERLVALPYPAPLLTRPHPTLDDAGEEEEEEEEEALDELETSVAGVGDGDDALENPFLSGAASDATQQLSGLTDTLKDPSLVREVRTLTLTLTLTLALTLTRTLTRRSCARCEP